MHTRSIVAPMRYLAAAAVTLASVALSACSDSTSPKSQQFNSARVVAGTNAVQQAAASSAISSLDQLVRFGGGGAMASSSLGSAQWSPGLAGAVARFTQSATDAGAYLIPVIHSNVLGVVFTFDPSSKKYVPTKRGGAPSNGVRFILYKLGADSLPSLDQEVGYADITDEGRSVAGTASVKLVVVIGGVTKLSYAFAVSLANSGAQFDLTGFVVDGDERLNFTVNAGSAVLGTGPATIRATLEAPKESFTVKATIVGAPQDQKNGSIALDVSSGSDRVLVDSRLTGGVLDATFTVNGAILARATGDPTAPYIRRENGAALSDAEIDALKHIIEMSGDILRFIGDLVKPAGTILLIALGIGF